MIHDKILLADLVQKYIIKEKKVKNTVVYNSAQWYNVIKLENEDINNRWSKMGS